MVFLKRDFSKNNPGASNSEPARTCLCYLPRSGQLDLSPCDDAFEPISPILKRVLSEGVEEEVLDPVRGGSEVQPKQLF